MLVTNKLHIQKLISPEVAPCLTNLRTWVIREMDDLVLLLKVTEVKLSNLVSGSNVNKYWSEDHQLYPQIPASLP